MIPNLMAMGKKCCSNPWDKWLGLCGEQELSNKNWELSNTNGNIPRENDDHEVFLMTRTSQTKLFWNENCTGEASSIQPGIWRCFWKVRVGVNQQEWMEWLSYCALKAILQVAVFDHIHHVWHTITWHQLYMYRFIDVCVHHCMYIYIYIRIVFLYLIWNWFL